MQTFLPYADFYQSAHVLDGARLGKQRVEAWQILDLLMNPTKTSKWRNHPAVQMWKGYEAALARYGMALCYEWHMTRGYKDTLNLKFANAYGYLINVLNVADMVPPWLGSSSFHTSHRSNLLRKDPNWYRKFWPKLRNDMPYNWPIPKSTV
jgi:hypothetical protein